MKKYRFFVFLIIFFIFNTAFASTSNNLAGKYICNGYDRQDKVLRGTTLILTLNSKNSKFENGYSAYDLQWFAPSTVVVKGLPPNIAATGAVAANGNMLAVMFKNSNPKAKTDYGVLVGTATHDQDAQGVSHTVLHFFGYQPVYKGGDNSTWSCVKH